MSDWSSNWSKDERRAYRLGLEKGLKMAETMYRESLAEQALIPPRERLINALEEVVRVLKEPKK